MKENADGVCKRIDDVIAELTAMKEQHGNIFVAGYCGMTEEGQMVSHVTLEEKGKQRLYYKGFNLFELADLYDIGEKIAVIVTY